MKVVISQNHSVAGDRKVYTRRVRFTLYNHVSEPAGVGCVSETRSYEHNLMSHSNGGVLHALVSYQGVFVYERIDKRSVAPLSRLS